MAGPAGIPEWPKGAGCKPAGSAFGGSNPPPCTSVKLTLRFGKHIGRGRLSPEQQAVVERLERDEITPEEAQKLLGGSVRVFDVSIGTDDGEETELPPDPAHASESDEDARAREMIERIAREVDEEMRR
jgi:hypothetical protein